MPFAQTRERAEGPLSRSARLVLSSRWKTRSVFDRYNIVDEKDLAEAAALLDAKAQQRELRHSSDTVSPKLRLDDEGRSVN